MSLRIAVTGAEGFVGRHVARLLRSRGHSVFGIVRNDAKDLSGFLDDYVAVDLTERWPSGPELDVIVHLAGLSAVGPSFEHPQRYITDNSAMVVNMCESLLSLSNPPRILGVSSGSLYQPTPTPTAEDAPLQMDSPYSVSKALLENVLAHYRLRGIQSVVVRPFNHVGPGQGPGFLVPDLFDRIGALEVREALSVGDLSTSRDYTDVRDVAMAYALLCEAPSLRHFVYNVASGHATSGFDVLREVCSILNVVTPQLMADPVYTRPADKPYAVGDATRIRHELGWSPSIPLRESLGDFLLSASSGAK